MSDVFYIATGYIENIVGMITLTLEPAFEAIDIDISILISCIFDIVNITTRNKLDNIVYHHCIKILDISGYYLL